MLALRAPDVAVGVAHAGILQQAFGVKFLAAGIKVDGDVTVTAVGYWSSWIVSAGQTSIGPTASTKRLNTSKLIST